MCDLINSSSKSRRMPLMSRRVVTILFLSAPPFIFISQQTRFYVSQSSILHGNPNWHDVAQLVLAMICHHELHNHLTITYHSRDTKTRVQSRSTRPLPSFLSKSRFSRHDFISIQLISIVVMMWSETGSFPSGADPCGRSTSLVLLHGFWMLVVLTWQIRVPVRDQMLGCWEYKDENLSIQRFGDVSDVMACSVSNPTTTTKQLSAAGLLHSIRIRVMHLIPTFAVTHGSQHRFILNYLSTFHSTT